MIQVSENINGRWSSGKGLDETAECVVIMRNNDGILWGNPKYKRWKRVIKSLK